MEPKDSYRAKAARLLKLARERASEARDYLGADLWERPKDEFEGWYARGHALIQYIGITGKKFVRDDCQLRASALTYVTLIAIVPVLAVGFSVFKGLYLRPDRVDQFKIKVQEFFGQIEHLIPQMEELSGVIDKVADKVENVDAAALGAVGGILLFLTVVTTLGSIEKSFNRIWNVRRARTYLRRTADYIAVVVLGAVLIATATTLNLAKQLPPNAGQSTGSEAAVSTSTLEPGQDPALQAEGGADSPASDTEDTIGSDATAAGSEETPPAEEEDIGFMQRLSEALSGRFAQIVLRIIPIVSMFLLFSFLYFFFPNTRVRPTSAALGALTATILWQLAQQAYITFGIGVTRANAIYGALAQLPILLAWIYLSWMIVLIGAEVASVHQLGLRSFVLAQGRQVPFSMRERAGLDILVRIGAAFRKHDKPPAGHTIAQDLRIHETLAEDLLETLQSLEYVRRVDEEDPGYVPGRELQDMNVYDVLEGLRNASTRTHYTTMNATEEVDRILKSLKESSRETLAGITIADILDGNWRIESTLEKEGTPSESSATIA